MHLHCTIRGAMVKMVLLVYTYTASNTNTELDFTTGVHHFVARGEYLDEARVAFVIRFVPHQASVSLSLTLCEHLVLFNAPRAFSNFLTSRGTSTPKVQYDIVPSVSLTVSASAISKYNSGIKSDRLADTARSALRG